MATEVIPPGMLNPAPLTVAWEIVTFEFPALEIVRFWELLEPTMTSPKLKVAALALNVPDPGLLLFWGVPAPVRPTQPESDRTTANTKNRCR